MSDEPIEAEPLCDCPFCGAKVYASIDPEDETQHDGLIHEMPLCKRFEDMDCLEFITAVREEMERRQPN